MSRKPEPAAPAAPVANHATEYADLAAPHVVRQAPPPATGVRFIRDSQLPGFALKITARGLKTWIVEARMKGQKNAKRRTLGRYPAVTPERARRLAIQELGRFAEGVDQLAEQRSTRAKAVTLGEVFTDYLALRDLKPVTVADYEKAFRTSLEDWRHKQITAITRTMVEHRHRQETEKSPARANMAMRLLRALFNFAIGKYETAEGEPVVTDNPVMRLNAIRAWNRIDRRRRLIRLHELPAWFAAVEALRERTGRAPVVADWLEFLIFTGCRRTESLTLRWEHVNLDARYFVIPDPKNRLPHELPLSDRLHEVLTRRKEQDAGTGFVFPGTGPTGRLVNEQDWVRQVRQDSGVMFTPHDLRRTFATVAESLDIPGYALKRLMNHASGIGGDVTAGYLQIDVERLRVPMQRITDAILTAAGRRETAKVVPLRPAAPG
jgi:integrase